MKFKVNQTELNTALQHLVRNTDTKFFKDIKLILNGSKLKLQATNGEVSMEYKLEVVSDEEDILLVNARKFTDIINKLSGEITFDNGVIKSGKTKLKIDIKYTEDNFEFFSELKEESVTLNTNDLQRGIVNRLFACEQKSKNLLSGVCLNGDEIATCNGCILSTYKLDNELKLEQVVLSNKTAQEVLKSFNSETVNVVVSNNKIMFKADNMSIVGFLLQETYPNYKSIIPKHENKVVLNKTEVIKSIELLKLIDEQCVLKFANNCLTIEANDSSIEMEIDYSGKETSIRFCSDYLINCFKNIDSEVVEFGFINNRTGVTLSTDKELTLLMPIVKNN